MAMRYNGKEDRLILDLQTGETAVSYWLTRKAVPRLWTLLCEMMRRDPAMKDVADERIRDFLVDVGREAAMKKVRLGEKRTPNRQSPGTPVPLLAEAFKGRVTPRSQFLLRIVDQGNVVALPWLLTPPLLHGLCRLLVQSLTKTDWKIELYDGAPVSVASPQSLH